MSKCVLVSRAVRLADVVNATFVPSPLIAGCMDLVVDVGARAPDADRAGGRAVASVTKTSCRGTPGFAGSCHPVRKAMYRPFAVT